MVRLSEAAAHKTRPSAAILPQPHVSQMLHARVPAGILRNRHTLRELGRQATRCLLRTTSIREMHMALTQQGTCQMCAG